MSRLAPASRHLHLEPLEDRTLMSTCHVTRLTDQGIGKGFRGDLRYCINRVNAEPGPDEIDFTVTGTIQLNSTLPVLATEIDVLGPGADSLTVSRASHDWWSPYFRILEVQAGASARISNLTLTNGISVDPITDEMGGGAILNAGTLILEHVNVAANRAFSYFSTAKGGGIDNRGTMTIRYSRIADNTAWAPGEDPLHAYGGGIYNEGSLTIENSTISGNRTDSTYWDNSGGGIYNAGGLNIVNCSIVGNLSEDNDSKGGGIYSVSGGSLSILHSTIADNDGRYGGGIYGDINEMRNSIVARNHAAFAGDDVYGDIDLSGHNLIGINRGGSGYASTDILDVDPMLGPLTYHGGPTETMALLPGSPAIDAGDNTDAPEWDQRGTGFPRIVNGTIDIGAFEVQSSPMPGMDRLLAVLVTAEIETG